MTVPSELHVVSSRTTVSLEVQDERFSAELVEAGEAADKAEVPTDRAG